MVKRFISNINIIGLANGLITIIVILMLAKISIFLSSKAIDKFFKRNTKLKKFSIESRKAITLSVITQSLVKYFIYFIAGVMILQRIGIETRSLIATAGIGGVAIGFGAKSLVQDVITGFFILFEDQYSVGEHIQIGDFDGIVEDMQIRVTKIRAFNGELHIIPNGQIETVTNKSRGSMKADVDIRISYEEDIDQVFRKLEEVSDIIKDKYGEDITSGPIINGIAEFTNTDMRINMYAMTKPSSQFKVAYNMRKLIIEHLIKSGVDIKNLRKISISK
ncbi:MAG: mechanosensitive ion channel family protein [Andreesenia angusta]|nr:mechanosensitive ion channel family protein [Andreesenia angusta]